MKTFEVVFVFEGSGADKYIVSAKDEKGAINTIINRFNSVKQPEFTIINEIDLIQQDDDIDLTNDFQKCGDSVYKFKNKLAEVIKVGGTIEDGVYTQEISICLGNLQDWKRVVGEVK